MPIPLKQNLSLAHRLADHLLFPLNMWFGEESSLRLGLTPIDHERVRIVLPHCRGRLLDVGCGNNLLVKSHGNGVGVDIHPYPDIGARCDGAWLPFKSETFDSLALLASLNHITRRKETLTEGFRVLRRGGRILITMIPGWVGFFSHKIRKRHDPDQLERCMSPEEDWGLSTPQIIRLLEQAGFQKTRHTRFFWGLNNLHIAEKP